METLREKTEREIDEALAAIEADARPELGGQEKPDRGEPRRWANGVERPPQTATSDVELLLMRIEWAKREWERAKEEAKEASV